MAENVRAAPLQSAGELKAQIETERLGVPFLVYRGDAGGQQIFVLHPEAQRISVGRGSGADVCLEWDTEVSRLHAELERIGDDWTVSDDGLSRNGTHVNGERVVGKRRLRDGDMVRFGRTVAKFRQPQDAGRTETQVAPDLLERATLSDAQLRVLV